MKSICLIVLLLIGRTSIWAQGGNDTAQGQVAPELVGKWCYIPPSAGTIEGISNSCVTLNADGSYEIELDNAIGASLPGLPRSDGGTWWVKDDRLYYTSAARGKGSLRLQKVNHPRIENTPTLILDGVVFCPATPRDPW